MKTAMIFAAVAVFAVELSAQHKAPQPSRPGECFEHLWKTFDEKYGLFDVKRIDWKVLYKVYRPRVTETTSDDELFEILSDLLGHLNDNHVLLESEDPVRFFSAGYLYQLFGGEGDGVQAYEAVKKTMSQRPVPESYFAQELQESTDGVFAHGWAADSIGYFHFNRFNDINKSAQVIDEIVREFKDAKALIIDVRRNGGGDDRVGKVIADRFAEKKVLYMTTQDRDGPDYDDFAPPKSWYVEPDGPIQFTKTVLLLTDRTSVSAAENFALAMKVLPHVVQVGDLTSGCFADMGREELPNGWTVSYSRNLFLDHTGFCWEGIGVPPEIREINTKADEKQGRDRVFELALALIDAGPIEPKKARR
jgi:C-terminal processing protease CtpA/Prc